MPPALDVLQAISGEYLQILTYISASPLITDFVIVIVEVVFKVQYLCAGFWLAPVICCRP